MAGRGGVARAAPRGKAGGEDHGRVDVMRQNGGCERGTRWGGVAAQDGGGMVADDGYEAVPHDGWAAPSDDEMEARAEAFRARMATRRTVRDFASDPVPRAVIETCVATAATAPSGANQQPWHFEAITAGALKARIRAAAEEEEKRFYGGGASEEWLEAVSPFGTDWQKPHLTEAAWLIVVFAQRYGLAADGRRVKHYYVPESVGIACGFLIAALHGAGLATLTHTPNPMGFLREVLGRPGEREGGDDRGGGPRGAGGGRAEGREGEEAAGGDPGRVGVSWDGMAWTAAPPEWSVEDGVLRAVSGHRTDFWQRTYYGFRRDDGHAYLARRRGAFTAMLTFDGAYEALYDQAGLMIRVDGTRWIKFGIEWTDGRAHLSVVATDGVSDWSAMPVAADGPVTLRATRLADAVLLQHRMDGDGDGDWAMARLAPFAADPEEVGVGPYLCAPERAGFAASSRDFSVGPPAVEGLHG